MSKGNEVKYLLDYKHDRIKKGYPINSDFDKYWLHKNKTLRVNTRIYIYIYIYILNS